MKNDPSIAILIDCWNSPKLLEIDFFNNAISNIADFCTKTQSIKAIMLSSYHNDSVLSYDSPWYEEGEKIFYKETSWSFLKKIWKKTEFDKNTKTHPTILNLNLRDDQKGYIAFDIFQILYYCNVINRDIRNVYFCGFALNICVKNRPIGWLNFLKYRRLFNNDINFLFNKKCVGGNLEEQGNYIVDSKYWTQIDDDIFLLNKNIAV